MDARNTGTPAGLLPALTERRARRAFDPRPVPDDVQERLWSAVSVAPSHGNVQSTRLLVAHSPDVRNAVIAALSEGNKQWAPAAPLLAAVAALPSHERARGYGDDRALWALHAGIALGNLMAQATHDGLVAHPMANFDEPALRVAFGAPPEVRILAIIAIGYPGDPSTLPQDLQAREVAPQKRQPLSSLVVVDRWQPHHAHEARGPRD
ncbi:MAG: hypothetical protein Kow0010_12650 [Dehalococcoidia bacterium]